MEFNNVSDYEKLLLDRVTEVKVSDKTFYIRIAGPLNFDIMAAMANDEVDQEDRAAQMLCACLCDSSGVGLFNANNDNHVKMVKEFTFDEVTVLMNTIWGFFDKKKESEAVS
jgi:hypothetical protein